MNQNKFTSGFAGLAFAASLFLTACGGGGSSSGGGTTGTGGGGDVTQDTSIAGPMDQLQDPLTQQILLPLSAATAGTPLAGAVQCLNEVVVNDGLDVLDGMMGNVSPNSLSNPQTLFTTSEADVQQAVMNLSGDLEALQSALTGGACAVTGDGSNPLAGTPLAPLGDALAPVLATTPGTDMASLASFMDQLSSAFDSGMNGLSFQDLSDTDLPVLNGMLTTVQTLLSDLDTTLQAAAANNLSGAEAGATQTIQNLLNNVMTGVVPIGDIEALAGQGDVFSGPIAAGVSQLSALFSGGFDGLLDSGFENDLASEITSLFGPLDATTLPYLLDRFSTALAGGGLSDVTGTDLDAVLDPLSVLDSFLATAGGGATDSPLDLLLDPIYDALDAGSSCPVTGTALDGLCTLTQGLLDALTLDPDADTDTVLDDLVDDLLGGLDSVLGGLSGGLL